MAKFYGKVGYAISEPGEGARDDIYEDRIIERPYFGDVIRNTRKIETGASINDNLAVSNQISIVADPFSWEHFFAIRYVEWMGCLWKVTNVEVQRPRLLLTIGEVYNGPKK